jgi:hypothetical protein
MKLMSWPVLVITAVLVTVPTVGLADQGNGPPTLSFFSGGDGAHADWLVTSDQPPGDTDNQAIRLLTTNGAPTFAKGYAGISVHHVTGIPADSTFLAALNSRSSCRYAD